MTNIINSKTTKVALGLLVALFVLTGFAISAKASVISPLKMGMSGQAVMDLQNALISKGYSIPAGATGFFGNQTKAAVMAFQTAYASEVLAPAGLSAATGYWGMYSAAKMNALLASPSPTPTPTPTPTPSSGNEGSVTVTLESSPGNNTEIAYNQTKAVEAIKFKSTGSAMKINRIDFNFNSRLWRYATTAAVYDGSTKVAEMALTQGSFEEITTGSDYRLRMALDYTVPKDASKVLTLKITAPSIITNPPVTIIATVNANAVRATDEAGLTQYEPTSALATRTFKIKENTTGELTVTLDAASPDESTAIVDDVNTTEDVPLAIVNLKATNNDVTVHELVFDIATTTASVDDVADAIKLYKGSTLVGTGTLTTGSTAETATFSDLDEVIAKDATVKYTVKADMKADDGVNYSDAETISASLTANATSIDAEDADFNSLTNSEIGGTAATGNDQHLYVVAPVISFISASASKTAAQITGESDHGNYTIRFSVKAQGADIYVDKTVTMDASPADGNLSFEDVASNGAATITSTGVLASSADEQSNSFKIVDGTTETFTLTVSADTDTATFLKETLSGLSWGLSNSSLLAGPVTYGFDDFKTDNVYLNVLP